MPCYRPRRAYRLATGGITFTELQRHGDITQTLDLPCRQCIGCRLDRASAWALRIMHEAQTHDESCFITLTYDDYNLPEHNSLNHEHFQKFIRAARKKLKKDLRYYMCGEYGETTHRPHYHACLFGHTFKDAKVHHQNTQGQWVKYSEELQKLWPHGFSTVGELTKESAGYTARYIMKKQTGQQGEARYVHIDEDGVMHSIMPPYNRMSLKPGIGQKWFSKYKDDLYNRDTAITRGGIKHRIPDYYDKLYEREGNDLSQIKAERQLRATIHAENNTTDRLAVRETVHRAKIKTLKRELT